MKVRKRCQSAQLQTELIELLKHMFLPPKKMIKEQVIFRRFQISENSLEFSCINSKDKLKLSFSFFFKDR